MNQVAGKGPRPRDCKLCSSLADSETATQKAGWEELSSRLPAVSEKLVTVKDLRPGSFRKLLLLQCPVCHTCYLYRTDYEYLAGGTEDEEHLTRLSDEAAAVYLKQPD